MFGKAVVTDMINRSAENEADRRSFLKAAGVAGLGAVGGAAALGAVTDSASAAPAITDGAILNFALNLEYLEAEFYQRAAFGVGLSNSLTGGKGKKGNVVGGQAVPFKTPAIGNYAREIAQDELAHVKFLRAQLGASAVAQPAIDIGTDPNGAFSSAARAAGLIGAGQSFDPYLNDENFLLGAFIFEDVGVTAYKGAAPLITNKTYLEAAAGILAVEAYHASIVRTTLYRKGVDTPAARTNADLISEARDTLDGIGDYDQGISPVGSGDTAVSNIVPLDSSGLAFSRTTGQVLNIVYLNPGAVGMGGFFPAGVNGAIRTSTANGGGTL